MDMISKYIYVFSSFQKLQEQKEDDLDFNVAN